MNNVLEIILGNYYTNFYNMQYFRVFVDRGLEDH
jgi:hypothetical protein